MSDGARTPREADATQGRVLIVDDDDEARSAAAEALRAAGFAVSEIDNGLDALKAFESIRPHLALLEVMTPFVDGYSTCRAMRDMPGGDVVSIVMMTNLDDLESLRFGYEAGATDFITKPINPVILQHRMRYMLRAAEVTDALRRSERTIAHIADHDALTGLPNRRSLEKYMRRLTATRAEAATGGVFLLDLDGFKRVNDTFGHTAGDELICQVGRRLTRSLQVSGWGGDPDAPLGRFLARLGGDEFVFVDPAIETGDAAAAVAADMIETLGEGFDVRGYQVAVGASIGIALLADVGGDIERLIQCADAAMYDAKSHDRNTARFYSPELSERSRTHLDIENALRSPGFLDELELFYQPKVDVASGRTVGAEALLRWRSPERGLVPPGDFIGIAEESGLIVAIGRWALQSACDRLRAWQASPELRDLKIAVNVSPRQFRDPHFLDDVRRMLAQTGIDPGSLELEITEGVLINDTKAARALLGELERLGLGIALDDFGTGYSALGYLRQFPFDTLKIDRSFVAGLHEDDGSAAITAAIVAMASRLDLRVVAEGVETRRQLESLRALGCDQVQGYLFSRPVPISEFEDWVRARAEETRRCPSRAA